MASRRNFGAAAITAGAGVALSRWFSRRDEDKPVKLKLHPSKAIEAQIGRAKVKLIYSVMPFSEEGQTLKSGTPVRQGGLSISEAPVVCGNLRIPLPPPASVPYQFYIIASDPNWVLVIRKMFGEAGTLEPPELGRTEMTTRKLEASVENLEWVIEEEVLKMRWGMTEASVKLAAA